MTAKVSTNRDLSKWPFDEFKRWHKDAIPGDKMTAEQRYKSMGGILPKEDKVKPIK